MIHIVFDTDDADALRQSFALDENLEGPIIVVDEDWSIGPLLGTISSEGVTTRRDEWMSKLFGTEAPEADAVKQISDRLNDQEEEDAWIWIAPNARDVCGYYHLITNLEQFKGRLYTLWLNNLPFINEKGQIFYPVHLDEIPAKEFVKARRLAQPVSGATFETDPDEWKKMQRENRMLRVLEGAKKIAAKPETWFDKQLMSLLQNDWQKNAKLIHQVVSKDRANANRWFLLWRLRELISENQIEARGDWPSSENFDIKKPALTDLQR